MGLASAALVLALGIGSGGWDHRITAHYRAGKMLEVVQYRNAHGWAIPDAQCYIAHPTIPLGEWVQVQGMNTGKVLRCMVADTSQPWDRDRHIRTRLVEVDFWSALILCGSTKLRNDECPTRVRRMK